MDFNSEIQQLQEKILYIQEQFKIEKLKSHTIQTQTEIINEELEQCRRFQENFEKQHFLKKNQREENSMLSKLAKKSNKKSRYTIRIMTGDIGTDASVKIRIVTAGGRELKRKRDNWIKIDKKFQDTFEEGHLDEFDFDEISGMEEGDPNEIEVSHNASGFWSKETDKRWYLSYIVITNNLTFESFPFPWYGWIEDEEIIIRAFDSQLPQNDTISGQLRRDSDLKKRRTIYEYIQKLGLPPRAKSLPSNESFSFSYLWDIVHMKGITLGNKILSAFSNLMDTFETFKEYKKLFVLEKVLPLPEIRHVWEEDENFGYQRLQGPNPMHITKLTSKNKPEIFSFDSRTLSTIIKNDFEEEFKKGKIYICDYTVLDDLIPKARIRGYDMGSPIVLFYQFPVHSSSTFRLGKNAETVLKPIGIQLYKDTKTQVYYPEYDGDAWKMAKMIAANADVQVHQCYYHLGYTHLVMEGFCVANHRCLSTFHPIHRLLSPHFRFLLAINSRGFETLIAKGGWIDKALGVGVDGAFELLQEGYSRWSFKTANPILNFEQRQVNDIEYYPYRDDSLLIYDCINNFVSKLIKFFYKNEDSIKEDWEIQNFVNDLVEGAGYKDIPCYPRKSFDLKHSENFKDLKWEISSHEDLIFLLSTIIFTCTVQHAAVNMPQYDYYSWIPNYPGVLKHIPQTKDEKISKNISEKELILMLPNKSTALDQIAVTKILSNRGSDALGQDSNYLFFDDETQKAQSEFLMELQKAKSQIEQRNPVRPWPYPYLNPLEIPNSIAI